MGLDIGIISIEHLRRPKGIVYKFAWRLAREGAPDAYMFGEGGSWTAFTKRQVGLVLDDFARQQEITPAERSEVEAWLETLPWMDDFTPPNADEGDDSPSVELYFNW